MTERVLSAAKHWTAAEFEKLETLAGELPTEMIHQEYNKWAKRNGYPTRRHKAILLKLRNTGISFEPVGEWITCKYIAGVLGVEEMTPRRWIRSELVKPYRSRAAGRVCIRRADLVDLARKMPQVFGGIEESRLYMLLEDEQLARQIAKDFPRKRLAKRPIQNIETGVVYKSVGDAANEYFVRQQSIHSAIKTGGTCANFHWRYV